MMHRPLSSSGGFFGVADFLVREPASGGYTVWDAKLSRHARPQHALQLCCYAEMLGAQQGAPVERVGLILGSTPLVLRVASYDALYRRTRARFLSAQDAFDASATPPELPAPRAPAGRWSGLAASQLELRDDLLLVARLSRSQAARLRSAGICTATELSQLSSPRQRPPPVSGVPERVVRRLAV